MKKQIESVSIRMKPKWVLYPFFFSLYPIVFLFLRNANEVSWTETFLPAGAMVSIATFFFAATFFLFKNSNKAGLITCLLVVFFFHYGYLQYLLLDFKVAGQGIASGRYLVPSLGAVFIFLSYRIIVSKRDFGVTTSFLNKLSLWLLLIPLATFFLQQTKKNIPIEAPPLDNVPGLEENFGGKSPSMDEKKLPDIYYIILDGYARADILKERYQYDNGDFIDWLKRKGFYVADQSCANYAWTMLSVSSSLNFDYLQSIVPNIDLALNDWNNLSTLIRGNRVVRFLKRRGYKFVTVATSHLKLDVRGSDLFLRPRYYPGAFQTSLLETTIFPTVAKKFLGWNVFLRQRFHSVFAQLLEIPKDPSPLFVYAHIMAPHFPFLFGQNGEIACSKTDFLWNLPSPEKCKRSRPYVEDYIADYRNYLGFVNGKIEELIETILSRQQRSTVIILQADHGPAFLSSFDDSASPDEIHERMGILNACYFPQGDSDWQPYETMTPVNTFRIVLNKYFGTKLEILKDESFFSTCAEPFQFTKTPRGLPRK